MKGENSSKVDSKITDSKIESKQKKETWMCAICGCIFQGPTPIKCPCCGAGKENFVRT